MMGRPWYSRNDIGPHGTCRRSFGMEFWRFQISMTIYRNAYPVGSDRWVFIPELVYDCRDRKDIR